MRASKFIIIFFLLIIIPLLLHSQSLKRASQTAPCRSIDEYDFKNAEIKVKNRGVLKFHLGTAHSSDSSESAIVDHPDWQSDIVLEQSITPQADLRLRAIIISSGHLTGAGSWGTVLIFSCLYGHLLNVFEKQYLGGAQVIFLEPQVISIHSPDWVKDDAMCCPSYEKLETFRWNPSNKTFDLFETIRHKHDREEHAQHKKEKP